MLVILFVAVVGKLIGCGLAALASGMDWSQSPDWMRDDFARRGGPDRYCHGGKHWNFGRSEVAVMVAVVLLTTLLTPVACAVRFS